MAVPRYYLNGRALGHTQTIKPAPLATAVPGGFAIHDSRSTSRPARSPAKLAIRPGLPSPDSPASRVTASVAPCCTTATGGAHDSRPSPRRRAARDPDSRRRATTSSFNNSYRRWRPMVERSLAWLVADACRRVPYRGIDRNDLW
jgi:hypothetical protein